MQGMIALALSRTGDTKTPAAILKSLKETSIANEETGMYWKDQQRRMVVVSGADRNTGID